MTALIRAPSNCYDVHLFKRADVLRWMKLICPLCTHAVAEGVESQCGHVFCRGCAEQACHVSESSSMRCGHCERVVRLGELHRSEAADQVIAESMVRCANAECTEWCDVHARLDAHLEECPWTRWLCDRCGEAVTGTQAALEHTERCAALWTCVHCQEGPCASSGELAAHLQVCKEMPVECPNACGSAALARVWMNDQHLPYDCPRQRVACPFVEWGCAQEMERASAEQHAADATTYHLQLCKQRLEEQQSQIDQLASRLERVLQWQQQQTDKQDKNNEDKQEDKDDDKDDLPPPLVEVSEQEIKAAYLRHANGPLDDVPALVDARTRKNDQTTEYGMTTEHEFDDMPALEWVETRDDVSSEMPPLEEDTSVSCAVTTSDADPLSHYTVSALAHTSASALTVSAVGCMESACATRISQTTKSLTGEAKRSLISGATTSMTGEAKRSLTGDSARCAGPMDSSLYDATKGPRTHLSHSGKYCWSKQRILQAKRDFEQLEPPAVGDLVDVRDNDGQWCLAEIVRVALPMIRVHYLGFPAVFDATMDCGEDRVQDAYSRTGIRQPSSTGGWSCCGAVARRSLCTKPGLF